MTKLSYIYLISFVLLVFDQMPISKSIYLDKTIRTSRKVRLKYRTKAITAFVHAISSGDKRLIKRDQINKFKSLNLIHLFTPSGLHFTSLFMFLSPLLNLLRRKNKALSISIELLLSLMPLRLESFFSLKRIALLRFFNLVSKLFKKDISSFYIFILVFIIDFILGSYRQSPLSFIYSFLFLGIIFSKVKHNILTLIFLFLSGQIIICFFQDSTFTHLGFIQGFFITMIFTLIFPILFFHYWLGSPMLQDMMSGLISTFISFVNSNAMLAQSSGVSYSSISLLLIIFIFSLKNKKGLWLTPVLLLLHSNPIYSFPKSVLRYERSSGIDANWLHRYDSIKRTQRGYKLTYSNGYTCYSYLSDYFYERNCKLRD